MVRSARTKLGTIDEVRHRVEEGRRGGARVALATGTFDVLQAGHVRYLSACRAEADLLVVGVRGDAAARRVHGSAGPIVPAVDRALLVAAVRVVDQVVVFDEDEAAVLIDRLRPEVFCSRAGSPASTAEAAARAHGIRIVVIDVAAPDDAPGLSDGPRR